MRAVHPFSEDFSVLSSKHEISFPWDNYLVATPAIPWSKKTQWIVQSGQRNSLLNQKLTVQVCQVMKGSRPDGRQISWIDLWTSFTFFYFRCTFRCGDATGRFPPKICRRVHRTLTGEFKESRKCKCIGTVLYAIWNKCSQGFRVISGFSETESVFSISEQNENKWIRFLCLTDM